MRRLARLLILVAFARSAEAHPVPFSYLDLRLEAGNVSGTLTVHIFDAAHELNVDPPDRLLDASIARDRSTALAAMMASRLSLSAGDTPLPIAWGPVEVLPERQSLRLPFSIRGRIAAVR